VLSYTSHCRHSYECSLHYVHKLNTQTAFYYNTKHNLLGYWKRYTEQTYANAKIYNSINFYFSVLGIVCMQIIYGPRDCKISTIGMRQRMTPTVSAASTNINDYLWPPRVIAASTNKNVHLWPPYSKRIINQHNCPFVTPSTLMVSLSNVTVHLRPLYSKRIINQHNCPFMARTTLIVSSTNITVHLWPPLR